MHIDEYREKIRKQDELSKAMNEQLENLKRDIWNEAIEAAAEHCDKIMELGIAEDIRSLKK